MTYRRSKRGKPRIVAYIDGPFESHGATIRDRQTELREKVYAAMCARAETPDNYAFYTYEPAMKNPEKKEERA